jgi:phospholipase A1
MPSVAILIPGIMGSELKLGDEVIWPGLVQELVLPYTKMDKLMREDLTPSDIIRSYSISSQYQDLINHLSACGFHEQANPPTLLVFPYDWRKSNIESAGKLADIIDATLHSHDGAAEVTLIAHSMGGLIARYYLESGNFERRNGWKSIRRFIALAVPHMGGPSALLAALGQMNELWLSKDQVKQLVNDPRYPALYQLLPPQNAPFAWSEAELLPVSIYEPEVIAAMGLKKENIDSAIAFREGIDLTKAPLDHVRYFFFVGTQQRTTSTILLHGMSPASVQPDEIEDGGDGTVPVWSASLTGVQCQMVGGEHGTIYKDYTLKRRLSLLVTRPGMRAMAAPEVPRVQLALRDRVIEANGEVHATLSFPQGPMTIVKGQIRVVQHAVTADSIRANAYVGGSVNYNGPAIQKLSFLFRGPSVRGIYKLGFYADGQTDPSATDELIVQG